MKNDCLNYEELVEDALRTVVREVLRKIASSGLPAGHHLYVSFKTQAEGVQMADGLRKQFPDEMTIVLQHEYWDLQVGKEEFRVTLNFNKVPHELVIPLSAMSGFADQRANFGLQFGDPSVGNLARDSNTVAAGNQGKMASSTTEQDNDTCGPKIIPLDSFRKN